jgi:hypothetical protein
MEARRKEEEIRRANRKEYEEQYHKSHRNALLKIYKENDYFKNRILNSLFYILKLVVDHLLTHDNAYMNTSVTHDINHIGF